jgi:hypothetical protein
MAERTERELEEMAERLAQMDRDGFVDVICEGCGADFRLSCDDDGEPCSECGTPIVTGYDEIIEELSSF